MQNDYASGLQVDGRDGAGGHGCHNSAVALAGLGRDVQVHVCVCVCVCVRWCWRSRVPQFHCCIGRLGEGYSGTRVRACDWYVNFRMINCIWWYLLLLVGRGVQVRVDGRLKYA